MTFVCGNSEEKEYLRLKVISKNTNLGVLNTSLGGRGPIFYALKKAKVNRGGNGGGEGQGGEKKLSTVKR